MNTQPQALYLSCLPTEAREEITSILNDPANVSPEFIEGGYAESIIQEIEDFIGGIVFYSHADVVLRDAYQSHQTTPKQTENLISKLYQYLLDVEKSTEIKNGNKVQAVDLTFVDSGQNSYQIPIYIETDDKGLTRNQVEAIMVDQFGAKETLDPVTDLGVDYWTHTQNLLSFDITEQQIDKDSEYLKILKFKNVFFAETQGA